MICFEIPSGDIVAVAYFEDECHVYSAGKNTAPLTIGCPTLTAVDDHAEKDPGIGRAKTIFVYDPNDHEPGKCNSPLTTNTPNKNVEAPGEPEHTVKVGE